VFRIIVPLDDSYSFDAGTVKPQNDIDLSRKNCGLFCGINCTITEIAVLEYVRNNPTAAQNEIAAATGKSLRGTQSAIAELKKKGLLIREGARKNGRWVIRQ
jgi:ATP-dependent DNA helicase RecG